MNEKPTPNEDRLIALMKDVRDGKTAPKDAVQAFQAAVAADVVRDAALNVDLGRGARIGFSEVIFGEGKAPATVAEAAARLLTATDRLLVTRATADQWAAMTDRGIRSEWHAAARVIAVGREKIEKRGSVAVLCAGTTDFPVAEEASLTAEMWGAAVERHYDVGVAGLHRLLGRIDAIRRANAVVVCAGMEGALPSVVGGLIAAPLIACPTSVGYGASMGGLTALFAMLNSCAPGVTVVNIDNGFGAGYAAGRINHGIVAAERARDQAT